jgi:hypothetical protein
MEHEQPEGPQPQSPAAFMEAPEPAASPRGQTIGFARSTFGGLAIFALGAGVMTGVIPIPDFRALPLASAPAAVQEMSTAPAAAPLSVPVPAPAPASIKAQPQPLAQPSPGLLRPLEASELKRAIDGMHIAEAEKQRLRKEIATGDARLAWIVVSDWDVEDGDEVLISAAGYAQQVRLYHRPTTLAVPYKPGVPVTLTAAVDGDNSGITVAVHMGNGRLPLTLQPGTTVQVPTP